MFNVLSSRHRAIKAPKKEDSVTMNAAKSDLSWPMTSSNDTF
jgi:hypothetical protein